MADDGDDWMSAAAEEPEATPAAVADAGNEPPSEESADEGITVASKPQHEKVERTPLYKVWKRPVFLQYSYLYDYRHNYYDDVIDYLDRRQRGFTREIPRPQTWAERALRTYTSKVRHSAAYEKRERDIDLMSNIRTSVRFYNYHSREYLSHKNSKYLM